MDKIILRKFLKAGFMENGKRYPTDLGTPQGGIISPTLAVMALSGIEAKLISTNHRQRNKEKINIIAYADDFVVTAATEQLLKEKVMPTLVATLKEVGLELSQEKTRITSIEKGFDFLGFNVRKYRCGKLFIKPSKASIKSFLEGIKSIIRTSGSLPAETLIHRLNQKITGWTNYYRSVVSSKVFAKIDSEIFLALNRWILKRHPTKGRRWITNKYYSTVNGNHWRFHCVITDKAGKNKKKLYLKLASDTHIRRHTKIKADANPFDPRFREYFQKRALRGKAKLSNLVNSTGLITQPYAGLSAVR